MALTLIAGRSGSGKSRYIYNRIIEESIRDKEERFFVCVPDQFTMQTQKDLVALHPAHSIMNIDVLSFNRLAARVFDETGFNAGAILEDMGKTLLLQKVVWENKRSLSVLTKTMNRPGGIDEMKSLISEFMQYRISPGDLTEPGIQEQVPPLLSKKLDEIGLVYRKLKDSIEGKYLAAEEVCEALSAVIGQSEMIKGSTVVFDGFTGFVPVQLPVVREILKLAKDVIVVITADQRSGLLRKDSPGELFHMSHQMAASVVEIAKEERIEIADTVWIEQGEGRFAGSGPIAHLEENLFRFRPKKYEAEQDSIRIIQAEKKEDEIAFAAAQISRLVRTEGLRYRDIAVICADMESYGSRLYSYLEECGIPAFLDEKHSVLSNPFVTFLRSAVGIMSEDFSYDSVFSYLRSGFGGLNTEETDRMENYCLAAGIKGLKKYSSLWVRIPKTYKPEDLEYLNTLRVRFLDEIKGVTEAFKTRMSTVQTKTKALYELAVNCGAQQKLAEMERAFKERLDKRSEREYSQIFKTVIDFFDKLVTILGEEKIGVAAYEKLLDAGFAQMKLGIIPTGPDEVFIGDIERSRVKNVQVLIFMGLNDGVVPKRADKAGLLNENDREKLKASGMALAPSEKENMFRQRFYLYLNLTLASSRIFLTYRKIDDDGKGALPSYLIGTIRRLFPHLSVEEAQNNADLVFETAPGRRAAFLERLNEVKEGEDPAAFYEWMIQTSKDPKESRFIEDVLRAAGTKKKQAEIGAETANEIYEDRYSVTRLQLFANCAFAHFCKYGLKLNERQVYQMQATDIGSIFHDALKKFFLLAQEKGGVKQLTAEERDILADKAFDETIGTYGSTVMLESFRSLAQTSRMKRMIRTAIEVVKRQIEAGEFETEGIEEPYRLGKLTGTIDRYDVCRIGDTAYVRVIDYKSSQTKIDYTGMMHGLQIQLPVYLNAALDKVGKTADAHAAGIYYLGIQTPMLEAGSMNEEVSYEKFLKEMRFTGLTLDDPAIIEKQDENAISGTVLPVRLKKDGGFYKGTPVLSEGDFHLIERYTRRLVEEMEEAIRSGRAAIEPVSRQAGDEGHCKYCEYKSVCGYDEKIPGYRHKILESFDQKTFCPAMSRKLQE